MHVSMTRACLLLACAALGASASAFGAEGADPAALLKAATSSRLEAAATLSAKREEILVQRRRLFERINALQRQLTDERAAVQASAEKLDAARRRRDGRERELRRQREAHTRLLDQVAEACGLRGQLPLDDLKTVGARVGDALSARLACIEHDSRLRRRTLPIADRKGRGGELTVIALGSVQELAVGPGGDGSGFLARDGRSAYVSGPQFAPSSRTALLRAADGHIGSLPCDVTGTLATQQGIEPWTLAEWIGAGGIFMWPILLAALAAIGLAVERFVSLARLRVLPEVAEKVMGDVRTGKTQAARDAVAGGLTPLDRVLRAGLKSLGLARPTREAALEAALLHEHPRFERSLTLLAALAAVAPLLGLLGTVTGMIGTFETIAVNGTGNPRLLSGGISEALITTQAGLLTAVPILLMHAWIGREADSRQSILEQAAASMLAVGKDAEHGDGIPPVEDAGQGVAQWVSRTSVS